jgi:glycosyltransferase involved in cell wall biosynthesis
VSTTFATLARMYCEWCGSDESPTAPALPVTVREPVQVSLVICTRNRAMQLQRCLASIAKADASGISLEIVLVDNGSTDHTQRVICTFRDGSLSPVETVQEPDRGLGVARNAGLARARGEVIAFTDDDCYLARDYLLRVSEVFHGERFQFCGGRVLRYDPSDSSYGCDESQEPKRFPPFRALEPGAIRGANMVFRRVVVDRVGRFDPMFGAGTPFRCEDIDYCARASLAGFTGAYVPELVVYHHHGRKPGIDTNEIEKSDAYARGAYYVKFILRGEGLRTRASFVQNWMRLRVTKERNLFKLAREIRGALRYVRARAHHIERDGDAH